MTSNLCLRFRSEIRWKVEESLEALFYEKEIILRDADEEILFRVKNVVFWTVERAFSERVVKCI